MKSQSHKSLVTLLEGNKDRFIVITRQCVARSCRYLQVSPNTLRSFLRKGLIAKVDYTDNGVAYVTPCKDN